MNTVVWALQILLALAFFASGLGKAVQSKQRLAPRMPWVGDFSPGAIRTIGVLEMLGAVGLVLPAATGIAPVLTPLAAVGLALVMVGAAVVHGRRGEYGNIVVNVVLLALTVVVAWARFGPYSY